MAAKKTKIELPSVLAFERKLDVSDGLFKSGIWADRENHQNWEPVLVREKSIRGTVSNRTNKIKEIEKNTQNANLQRVDVASISCEHDSFSLQFTCKILGGVGNPSVCNQPAYQQKIEEKVSEYISKHGFTELGARYAVNLANGRFLWRNRFGAEELEVCVQHLKQGEICKEWTFEGHEFSLNDFTIPDSAKTGIAELTEVIANGLGGALAVLKVTAFARIGAGQELYPSEELILDKGNAKGQKSKTLYSVGGVAGFHSQKISNALRTIDTWYEGGNSSKPIAVEPYGSVTSQGVAYRLSKNDFFTIIDQLIIKDKELDRLEDQHFMMANLIRGGVFGGKD
ncbi:type I-F CRISPR-associated protein Csy3 [Maridesulfovibrio hydrothermalis]|nr:type I-F CRISPR-associated protein Csy3 [Maridesulfovibrio hydrothermalis]